MKDLSYEELLEQEISILEQELREAREEQNKQKIARSKRKEKIEQEISRLERLISEKDDALDEEQGKRVKTTFFVICGVIYVVLLYLALENRINVIDITISGIEDLKAIFYLIVILTFGVAFAAGLIMFISFGVLFYIMNGALKRAETIAKLEGELIAIKLSKYDKE